MPRIDAKLSPKISDYNGDGKKDILWRNYETISGGNNTIWLMNGTTIAAAGDLPGLSPSNSDVVGFGDFNSDGQSDLLWRNFGTGDNTMWLMNGTTIAAAASLPGLASGSDFSR